MSTRTGKSKTQLKREAYNYRAEYFKYNPGLFGCIWFCSQCYRPLFGKNQVVIDHIIPLAKGGRNHVSNCTACCRKCNAAKSDKVDARIAKGYAFKVVESNAFRAQRGAGAVAGVGLGLSMGIIGRLLDLVKLPLHSLGKYGPRTLKKVVRKITKVVTYPIRKGPMITRLGAVALYAVGIMYLLTRYTNLF